jgi:quercetin dioxygenase-like cupin family protein
MNAALLNDSGHFMAEEALGVAVKYILGMTARTMRGNKKMTYAQIPLPADDPNRRLTIADPDGVGMRHISVVGDTYTILVSGAQTAGRYCLIDMLVPDGSGPPPHRHDFEEMFTLLEGELEFTFRGNKTVLKAGETVNIPANAPHVFKNKSGKTVRMLCMCTPAGQDEFFIEVGQPVAARISPAPKLDKAAEAAFIAKVIALAPKYRTELLKP